MEVNSKEYWDARFRNDWEAYNGTRQTRGFILTLIRNLPEEVCTYIEKNKASILDWGCALGQGVEELSMRFPLSEVTGLDISDAAIAKCKVRYPACMFKLGPLDPQQDRFDVIVNSNCLEHFSDYLGMLSSHMLCANAYYVIMVPYCEQQLCSEHKVSLQEDSFPDSFLGFKKVVAKVIDTRNKGFWNGDQMLVVYKRNS